MNLKDNYFIIVIVFVAILILVCVFISAGHVSEEKTYINITDDGAIKFDTTGFEVNKMDILEEVYTGQLDNKTFYTLKDYFGREVEITIHHSSMNDSNSSELYYLSSDYYKKTPIWIGNHSGSYYSVLVSDTDYEDYFNVDFINQRIIIDQ